MRRQVALALGLLLLVLAYVGFVAGFGGDLAGTEQRFGNAAGDGLQVYVTIANVDPVNDAASLRLYVTPPSGQPAPKLRLDDGFAVQEVAVPGSASAPPSAAEITLSGGRASSYPLERFRGRIGFAADGGAEALPVGLTVWDGIAGWHIQATARPGEPAVTLEIRRSAGLVLFVLAIYATMVMIGSAALLVSVLVFLRIRRLETSLAGFLSGILFALPAMRYALPGAPPFGVFADQLAFLWAELAAAIALLLFVFCWALNGPRH